MSTLVLIKNITTSNLRIGTTTIVSLASATVDVDDEKTARDLDSLSGRYVVNDAALVGTIPLPSATTPVMDSVGAAGVATTYSRGDHVHPSDMTKANLASPTFTGVPLSTTAAVNTNTTQIATTAFVVAQASGTNPLMNGSVAIGGSLRYSREDHVHATDTSRAPINSPVFTGDPQAPTPLTADNDTSIATTAYVKAQSYLDTTTAASTYAPIASPTFTGDPKAPTAAPGDNDTSLATTAFIQAALGTSIPPGVIWQYGAAAAPTGWLICDGTAVDRTTYAALFAIISTTYGVGDGSTTFNLPDFRGRVAMGVGTGDAADATAHALASEGGTEGHTLTTAQLPAHDHGSTPGNGLTGSTTPGVTGAPSNNTSDGVSTANTGAPSNNTSDGVSTANTGAGSAHTHTVTDAGHSHDPIGSVTYHSGTTFAANRISAENSAGGGVTTVSSTAALTTNTTGITNANESAHTHPMPHTHTMGNHTHTMAHTHTMGNHTHTSAAHTHALASVGSGTAHNNLQPFLTVNYIIKT